MNGGQAAATIESIVSYARHAAGNRDGGQAAATIESIVSYARHAVGNHQILYLFSIQEKMMGIRKWI